MKPLAFFLALVGFYSSTAESRIFEDVTEEALPTFIHENGALGELWLPEILGPGVGLLDFDQDGLLDIWAIQGGSLTAANAKSTGDQLFRNESESGELLFKRITKASGVVATEYGMGIATGDVDLDGDLDVFLANYGKNELWINQGDGTFVRGKFGRKHNIKEWSVAASFADVNRDGALDLYVANYVEFSEATHKKCLGISPQPDYCAPTAYPTVADRLYINTGNGEFVDQTNEYGIDVRSGAGLGVLSTDINLDGFLDFYVANDPTVNFLWQHSGVIGFKDIAMVAGVAVNLNGKAEASMGVVAEDFDRDCDEDLFMTNLTAETNTLFSNSGQNWFVDTTNQVGLGASSLPYTGFGVGWIDLELDGDLDLVTVNGAVSFLVNRVKNDAEPTLGQRNQIWLHESDGSYREHLQDPFTEALETSRGAAFGDLDNDGDIDVVVANNNGPLRIFENISAHDTNWLGLLVLDDDTVAHNAKVQLVGRNCVTKTVRTDGSYASANDPRVVFGLGQKNTKPVIQVHWLDGESSEFGPLAVNQYHVLNR